MTAEVKMETGITMMKIGGEQRPAVTSLEVAERFEKPHKNILKAIREMKCSEDFRADNFAAVTYKDKYGRDQPMYAMSLYGFDFLTLGLDSDVAHAWREVYVKEFRRMATEEKTREVARLQGKAVRRTLTEAIRDSGENERMHGHAYSTYTDLVYRAVFGMTAKKLRAVRGIESNEAMRDAMSTEELDSVMKIEAVIVSLLDIHRIYDDIKLIVLPQEALPAPSRKALPAGEESTGKKATGKKRGRKKALVAAGA